MEIVVTLLLILAVGCAIMAVLALGFLAWIKIQDRRDDMALRDCGPQDPGAPDAFQLMMLYNELIELHAGKKVGADNCTVAFICQCARHKHQECPKVPNISDKDLQDSPQARESLADWLHSFALCVNHDNRLNCGRLAELIRAW